MMIFNVDHYKKNRQNKFKTRQLTRVTWWVLNFPIFSILKNSFYSPGVGRKSFAKLSRKILVCGFSFALE